MKSTDALRILAHVTTYQWGMVTSAQASRHEITRLDLSRLTQAGHLERLAHGVYKDAGAPAGRFDDLHAAWLSTDPKTMGEVRIKDSANGVVVAGETAADLHGIGDFRALRHDFVSPTRRQSQRRDIRYRQRALDPGDVMLVHGLPVMTVERTIADLVEALQDLSLIADALRDASGVRTIDLDRLRELLAPLAGRNGFRKGDGAALLHRLMEIAGIDADSLARLLARSPSYRTLAQIARQVANVTVHDPRPTATGPRGSGRRGYHQSMTELAPTLRPLAGPTGRLVAAHRRELNDVLRRHGVTNARIFGSVARGDDHEGSDLDLLVDFAPGTSLVDIIGIQDELESVLGAAVDLVPDKGLKERVRASAEPDLIAL
jgi:predicted nucleotidyltransferase/predicted transcriptional regulator of viral defense system